MAKRRLSKSDVKDLAARLQPLGLGVGRKDAVDVVEDGDTYYFVNDEPWFFELDGRLIPHLRLLLRQPASLKQVVVDMGAVRFVTNGADVMRPGVRRFDDTIAEGDIVMVVDERHGKPLAVGRALSDTESLRAATGGKAVANLHWVGDRHWQRSAELPLRPQLDAS